MDFTRHRLRTAQLISIACLLFVGSLWADWNEDFLEGSYCLVERLDPFENSGYESYVEEVKALECRLRASALYKTVGDLEEESKTRFAFEGYLLKKRPLSRGIRESLFWEVAVLFGLDAYVTPSFPLQIGDNFLSVQPFEQFTVGGLVDNLPEEVTNRVSLRDYWYAHLLAFLLGHDDLSGSNIAVNCFFYPRFFDNEDVFWFGANPTRREYSFYVPFLSVAFDWRQYRQPLDKKLAWELAEWSQSLAQKRKALQVYAEIRNMPSYLVEGIEGRMEKIAAFAFREGTTFLDFFSYLYPRVSEGLEELNFLANAMLERVVGHGITLFFTTKVLRYVKITPEQREELDRWMVRYVD